MCDQFRKKADALLASPSLTLDEMYLVKEEAINLDRRLARWQDSQVNDFNPTTIGHITTISQDPGDPNLGLDAGLWPGKVDTYFDPYVAAVWNISRTVRCWLIDLILTLSKRLNDNDNQDHSCQKLNQDAVSLTEDFIASIPYHLTEDLQAFLRDKEFKAEITSPGRPVGGLLLMHPAYVMSKLSIVPSQLQDYIRNCLAWIEGHMGIGQAGLFARVSLFLSSSFSFPSFFLIFALASILARTRTEFD